jgi:hypothetical protein
MTLWSWHSTKGEAANAATWQVSQITATPFARARMGITDQA